MKDKSTVCKAFNKHFFDFIEDLMVIFPNSKEITFAKSSFTTVNRFNVSLLIKQWYNNVYIPYGEQIANNDIDFFLKKDYSSYLNKNKDARQSEEIIKMIENIRQPIANTDEVNKQHSLKYLQNLNKLSVAYNNL